MGESMARNFKPLFEEGCDNAAAQYATADDYAEVRVGAAALFWNGLLNVRCAPLSSIAWAYMRQEDSRITVCCGKGILPGYFLMLMSHRGELAKIPMEKERNVQSALLTMHERNPDITVGYSEQNAARFSGRSAVAERLKPGV